MAETPELDRIRALRREGATQAAIAKQVGKSRSYVQKVLARDASGSLAPAQRPRLKQHVRVVQPKWNKAEGSVVGESQGQVVTPPNHVGEWSSLGLEGDTWRALGRNMTLPLLSNVSPGISRAIWDYLRMLDPGHEVKVYRVGTEDVDETAQAVLDTFLQDRVVPRYASLKGLFQQMFMGALYRGAFCAQLVTDDNGRVPLELLIPDPVIIHFRPVEDEAAGMFWEPGIIVEGRFESVASPFFHYVAVDPLPGQPYGRSMIAPSSFPSIFTIGLLYDLRRVVAQQGYPRTDVTVVGTLMRDSYPEVSDEDFRSLVEEMVDQVSDSYGQLEPDDAFIHSDAVQVGNAAGAIDTGVMGGAVALIETLERMEIKALKTMPLMMGVTDGVSEANANRQWEIFVQGVKAMQHYAETVIQNLFELVLRVQGVQGTVEVRFAEVRSAEILRDETSLKLVMENAIKARDEGWITNEEASIRAMGHEPHGEPAPEPEPEESDEDEPEDIVDEDQPPEGDLEEGDLPEGDEPETAEDRFVRSFLPAHRRAVSVPKRRVDTAADVWEDAMVGLTEQTMLQATHVDAFADIPRDVGRTWYWVRETREFVYDATDRIDTRECRDVLDQFIERQRRELTAMVEAHRTVGSGVREWRAAVRRILEEGWRIVEDTAIAGMVLGRGGVAGMTPEAYDILNRRLTQMHGHWYGMVAEVLATAPEQRFSGDQDQILDQLDTRMGQYGDEASGMYEAGRSDVWGLRPTEVPPRHPRCNCYLEYGEDQDGPYASWMATGERTCTICERLSVEHSRMRSRDQQVTAFEARSFKDVDDEFWRTAARLDEGFWETDEGQLWLQYQASSYKHNAFLRGKGRWADPKYEDIVGPEISTMRQSFSRNQLDGDTMVYRGVTRQTDKDSWASVKPGSVIDDKGFVSTTYDREKAKPFGYGQDYVAGTTSYAFDISVPKGTRYMPGSTDPDPMTFEAEMIFPNGSSLRVREVQRTVNTSGGETVFIKADLIPGELP